MRRRKKEITTMTTATTDHVNRRALDSEALGRLTTTTERLKDCLVGTITALRVLEKRAGRLGHEAVDLEMALCSLEAQLRWMDLLTMGEAARTGHAVKPSQCLCARPPDGGCIAGQAPTPNGSYVPWGAEPWHAVVGPCPGCGCLPDQAHHLGCEQAACPRGCGHRLVSCACPDAA